MPQTTKEQVMEEFRKTMLFTKAGSWLECSDYEGTVTEMKKFISSTYDTAYEKGMEDEKEKIRQIFNRCKTERGLSRALSELLKK